MPVDDRNKTITELLQRYLHDPHRVEKLLPPSPCLTSELIEELAGMSRSEPANTVHQGLDHLTAILWNGIGHLAARSVEMTSILNKSRDLTVNLEASDSPLQGHFMIQGAAIIGGAGMVHFKDQDFRIFGTTRVLMKLLRGRLAMGLGNVDLQTDGHPGFLPILSPVIAGIAELVKGHSSPISIWVEEV